LYKTAQCHYKLKKYSLALKYVDKAKNVDSEISKNIDFFYGKTYHRMARLNDAVQSFDKFLNGASKRTIEYEMALKYVDQCIYAQQLMKEPIPVEIQNLGRGINSRFDEYAPSVTEDGKTIYFTSRRSDTQGGDIDEEGDYKFFEDIYIAKYDEEFSEWGDAVALPGFVNTDSYDAVLSVNPSGDEMFIYKNDARLAGDIFLSSRERGGENWEAPVKMEKPINSSYYEGSVSITSDGKTLYFISERPEGKGLGDIYVSKQDKSGDWQKPKNLGGIIN